MNQAPAVGIDLGTTYSCATIFQHGTVEIIANEQGNRTTPSVVSFNEFERLIGEVADDESIKNPTNTLFGVKRMLGRDFNDPKIQDDMKHWPFKIVNNEGKPKIEVTYKKEVKLFSPEEISSMVLTKMKEIAENYLGKTVKDVVITVPAYFNDSQRQATQNAGIIAGLNVLRIVNEPIAAAIAYGLDKKRQSERKVLIFDLGGGTFDVSILTINGGQFQVKTYAGDSHLGGEDFNNRIIAHFIREFNRIHKRDISNDKKAIAKLRKHCEKAKRTLTSTNMAAIEIDNLSDGIDFSSSISRAKFESLNADLFRSTIGEIEKSLNVIGWNKSDIDDIVLVGGSTRIPKIQEMLKEFFNGKDLYKSINPDEAVAYGAAIQAAILGGGQYEELKDFKFMDVTPLSLGVNIEGGLFNIVIPRNSPIPADITKLYVTALPNQTSMSIKVLEGERAMSEDNNLLGEFSLHDLPALPRGEAKADITFHIDANGILHVSAMDKSNTDNKVRYDIVYDKNRLSQEEIIEMIEEAKQLQLQDEKKRKSVQARNELEKYISNVEENLEKSETLSKPEKELIRKKILEIQNWIENRKFYEEVHEYLDIQEKFAATVGLYNI